MALFDWKLTRKSELDSLRSSYLEQQRALADLKLTIEGQVTLTKAMESTIKEKRRTIQRPLLYRTNAVSTDSDRKATNYSYWTSGYDLAEIGRAVDVEPYINQSIRKHREQILKEGFSVTGENDEMIDYVKRRLFEISLVSGLTTAQWLREFTTNLVTYGTAFLVIRRDASKSSGKTIRMYGKDLEPIAALFPMDPTSVSVSINDFGQPNRWMQRLSNPINNKPEIIFDVDDVIVATMDKKSGFIFGTPYILPTLDDVKSLRRLEEIAEIIGQRNGFPLFHFKVGDKEQGPQVFDDGTNEIELVRSLIENSSREGGLVTSNRVEGEVLGGDKQVLDIVQYLEYFEARVLGGLRLSEVDIGRGEASKASAITVSQGLQDSARDFQSVIADILTQHLLIPLCFEGGFDVDTKDNNIVWSFTMIDREEDRAHQAHGNDMYLAGTLTHDEFRRDYLKKKPVGDEEMAKLKPESDHAKAKELAEISGEQAIAKAKVTKATAVKNKSANKTRPTNQSGRKASKTKVTKNSLDLFKDVYKSVQLSYLRDARAGLWEVFETHQVGVNSEDTFNLSTKSEEINAVLDSFVTLALIEAKKSLDPILVSGCRDAMTDIGIEGDMSISKKNIDRFYKNYIEKSVRKIVNSCVTLINSNDALSGVNVQQPLAFYINSIIDQLSESLKSLCDQHIDLAYKVGYARTARSHEYKSIILSPDEDGHYCIECDDQGEKEVSLIDRNGSYSSILNTHHGCDFAISLGQK